MMPDASTIAAAAAAVGALHPVAQSVGVLAAAAAGAAVGIAWLAWRRPAAGGGTDPPESLGELTRTVLMLQQMVQSSGECAEADVRELRAALDSRLARQQEQVEQRLDRLTDHVNAMVVRVHERIDERI